MMKTDWQPFERAFVPEEHKVQSAKEMMSLLGVSMEEARRVVDEACDGEIWQNHLYQVNLKRCPWIEGMVLVHLSIKRRDKAPIEDWRDMQRIKNELVGEECEGVELYPAESRLVDSANQYHLWVVDDPEFRWPVGFQERFVHDGNGNTDPENGAIQRPRN